MCYKKNLKISKEFLIEQHIKLNKPWTLIAKEIGCSEQNLRYYFKKYNISNKTSRIIDIKGHKFGKLTVIRISNKVSKDKNILWECSCECGKKITTKGTSLRRKGTQSCGKCDIYEGIVGEFWSSLITNAKKRNLEYNLTKKFLLDLFIQQNKRCALSGIKLTIAKGSKNWRKRTNASLDRIDSSKGYIIDNVQWVHKKVNFMKQSLSDIIFINMCKKIANFNTKTVPPGMRQE